MSMVMKQFKINRKLIEREVPDFDWDTFRGNFPNAESFARKCYFAAVRRIIQEIEEGKNQTTEKHLESMEAVLVRSLFYTKQEVSDWLDNRDWKQCHGLKDDKIGILKEKFLELTSAKTSPFDGKMREKLAHRIAEVVDGHGDEIADYLLYKLDVQPEPVDDL